MGRGVGSLVVTVALAVLATNHHVACDGLDFTNMPSVDDAGEDLAMDFPDSDDMADRDRQFAAFFDSVIIPAKVRARCLPCLLPPDTRLTRPPPPLCLTPGRTAPGLPPFPWPLPAALGSATPPPLPHPRHSAQLNRLPSPGPLLGPV